jgi:hypothetical protein
VSNLPTDEQMRAAAKAQYEDEGSIEIDDDALISRAKPNSDKGAYVQAWVWVYDKDATGADDEEDEQAEGQEVVARAAREVQGNPRSEPGQAPVHTG